MNVLRGGPCQIGSDKIIILMQLNKASAVKHTLIEKHGPLTFQVLDVEVLGACTHSFHLSVLWCWYHNAARCQSWIPTNICLTEPNEEKGLLREQQRRLLEGSLRSLQQKLAA